MRIDALWKELESEARRGCSAPWLTRFALPQPSHPLLVALEVASARRALLLPLPKSLIPPRRQWPTCRGLEIFTIALSGQPHFGVRLRDTANADVFTALAEDVAPRIAAAASNRTAAKALLDRLRNWQRFLAAGTAGLSAQQQRGLFGELHTLRTHILPYLGPAAIFGWRAPLSAHQDFQFASGAIEVKTTAAKQPQAVRITSERQLDNTGVPVLFLHIVIVDERELENSVNEAGESLPDIIRRLREELKEDARALETFDDRLLDMGYLDAHAPHYEGRHFAVRKEHTFRIRSGFPRLVERNLPTGVGDINYALNLAACEPFSVSIVKAVASLSSEKRINRGGRE